MSTPSLTKRTWAFLASATIGLSGVAGVPAAFAAETNSHISAGEVTAASEQSLQDVTVNWGLKKSFRSYINGAFSQGSQELTGVTTNEDGSYHFTSAEGTVANGEYSVTFTGSSIHYTAHHGLLEVIISDLSVTIKDGVGTVRANVQSRPYNGNTTPNDLVETKNMTLGTFNASGLKVEGNTITLPSVDEENGTRVKLSEEATGAFAGFYKAGQELDALGFSATIVTKEAPAPSPEPSTEPSAEPTAAPTAEPSNEPSSAPTSEAPKPAEPTSAAPSAAPTSAAPSSPAATTEPKREEKVTGNVVESGTLSWDIRESFLKYLTGFAHGSVNVEGMEKTAAGGFKYTQASGVYNPETKTGQINFAGTAEFTGHNGQLKSTIKNMRLVVVNGKGTLVADVDALTRDGKSVSKTGLAIAEVDLSGASVKDGVFSAQNAAVALTAEGSEVLFAGQYRGADNAMAPLSFSVKLSEQTAENTVEVPRISENKSSDSSSSENKGSENNSSDNGSSNSSGNSGANGSGSDGSAGTSGSVSNGGSSSNGSVSNNPAQPVCVPVTRTREVQEQGASDGTIKSANLGWGVRDSFRNYVRGGIANGSWELNGTSYSSDAFNWSNGTGTFKGGKGSISFSGSVRFTGHHGILDTTIANPRLEINGNSGTLYATMNSNDPSGKATNYGEVALLKVDLSGLQSSSDAVSVNGAATTLTVEGAKAFAGFYDAGKDMAPLSFSAAINGAKTTTKTVSETVYEGEGCDPVTGKPLASTGASGVEGTLVAGFIAVAAGAGTVVYTRRRKKA